MRERINSIRHLYSIAQSPKPSAAMRTAAAAVLQAALCTALRAPLRHRTLLKASTQPFVYFPDMPTDLIFHYKLWSTSLRGRWVPNLQGTLGA